MYDKEEVEDSLEFCKHIRVYLEDDEKKGKKVNYSRYEMRKYVDNPYVVNRYAYQNVSGIRHDIDHANSTSLQVELFKNIMYIVACVAIAFVASYLITHYLIHHTQVDGTSMQSTLMDGDYLLIDMLSYHLSEPERFDIVVFPFSDDVNYIKRVIGLPGETVQITDGVIYINKKRLKENYGNSKMTSGGLAENPVKLGKDEYFVLGDNRNASVDSRRSAVGNVKREKILGRAWLRFFPFNRAGKINTQGRDS